MGSKLENQGDESVLLQVTHSNIKSFNTDARFLLQTTVESVKEKLWKKSGTSVGSMCLELYDDSGSKVSDLSDNKKPLGFYSSFDGFLCLIRYPFTMGRSRKWVKNIIPWKKSSMSHPSKKVAEENNAPAQPQDSSKELSATSTISNLAPRTTTIGTDSELKQTRSVEASHENNISTAANQTNESCATATEVMATETCDSLEGIIRLQRFCTV